MTRAPGGLGVTRSQRTPPPPTVWPGFWTGLHFHSPCEQGTRTDSEQTLDAVAEKFGTPPSG